MKKVKVTFRCKRYGKWTVKQMETPETIDSYSEACEYLINKINEDLNKDPENTKSVHEINLKFL